MLIKKMLGKSLLGATLGASLLIAVSTPAHADRDDRCRRDIHKAEEKLEKAVRKHGEHSSQAEERRRQLEEVRSRCHWTDHDHDQR